MEIHSPLACRRNLLKLENFEKFQHSSRSFERQYSGIYVARLRALKDHLVQKAKGKWGQYEVVTLSELSEKNEDGNCIVIGTLYKHQELKPSILRELSEELQLTTQPPSTNYASFRDLLFLEDEMLRIKLVGNHMNIQDVVTGIVCAVFGNELESGAFEVIDWCFPGCRPSKLTTLDKPLKTGGKILLVSGLDLANNAHLLSLNLLSEWIIGMIGSTEAQREVASVVCLIIAGNSVRGSVEVYNRKGYFEVKAHDEAIFKQSAMVTHKLDKFLRPIAQCCPVILMPGEFDPSCHTIPQQSFHPCILPECSSINSRIVVGSSGQPIMDIRKVAGLADISSLTWLERTLDWGHYVPTAPDTVPAYPYDNTDPFVITECPDIYFAGNMDKYDSKLFTANEGQTIRLICIPKFSETQTAVLCDLEDLQTWPVSFGIG